MQWTFNETKLPLSILMPQDWVENLIYKIMLRTMLQELLIFSALKFH